jgi:hypothetical protein
VPVGTGWAKVASCLPRAALAEERLMPGVAAGSQSRSPMGASGARAPPSVRVAPDLSGEPRRATLAALNLGPEPVAQAVAGPERTPFWTGPSAPDPSTFGRRPASSRFGASGRPKQTVGGAYIWPELTHANGIAGVSRQGRIRPLPSRRRRDRSRLGRSSGGRRGLPPDSVGGSYWRGHAVPNHGRPRG